MIALDENLTQSLLAVPGSVPRGRNAVAAFAAAAGASEEQLDAIRLAVSEALTNVVMHAYDGAPGEIHLTAAVAGGELWVLVADDGRGLGVRPNSRGLGMGLALIAQSAEELAIVKRAQLGTELRMRFSIGTAGGPRRRQARGSVACATSPASSRFSTTT
jgi:anti-sigma regulatory factor (Ser/Thr protein kinase)